MFTLIVFVLLQLFIESEMNRPFKEKYLYSSLIKGSHFRLHNTPTTWTKAYLICEAESSKLFIPESASDFEDFRSAASSFDSAFDSFFIGIHGLFSKGVYVTVKGLPIADTIIDLYWDQGKPDDYGGEEDCVVMTRQGLLDDRNCNKHYPFICRVYDEDIVPNYKCNNFDRGYKVGTENKCYKLHIHPLTWHDAYMVCALELGQLAIINNEEEAKIVGSYLKNNSMLTSSPDPDILFIGFTDLLYQYEYITIQGQTLKEAGYEKWSKKLIPWADDKFCGAITRKGLLYVTECEGPSMFICEIPVNKTHLKIKKSRKKL